MLADIRRPIGECGAVAIYLDNHSTTRLDPRVLDAMLPWLTDHYGNAGSVTHEMGREAREAVEHARELMAAAIGASPREIVFTSGATESANLAILGSASRACATGVTGGFGQPTQMQGHVITVATEHNAVLDPIEHLERLGHEVRPAQEQEALCVKLAKETAARPLDYGLHDFSTLVQFEAWMMKFIQGQGVDGNLLYAQCGGDCDPNYTFTVTPNNGTFNVATEVYCGFTRDRSDRDLFNISTTLRPGCAR